MSTLRSGMYGPLICSLDQGTGSTRFLVFASKTSEVLTYHQISSNNIYPHEGWVEQDPQEILAAVMLCMGKTMDNLHKLEIDPHDIKAIGICNQRETTIVWNKLTGQPLYNAIIWLDNRTLNTVEELLDKLPGRNKEHFKVHCGLPLTTYFSALKLKWLIDNVPDVRQAIDDGNCLFGTVDSWLIWNLTGGPNGGLHVTDVTNASRTMLMDIVSLNWDSYLCNFFQIPMSILPKIYSSSEIYGLVSTGPFQGKPISGCLGDQSAALVGQLCFNPGTTKNTYGTGCFLLCNTGVQPVWSEKGLLTTVAYKFGTLQPAIYALEGSVAIAGAGIQWLRDNMKLFESMDEVESLARTVSGTHGMYFVPAFSGLYAPYWQPSARGIICGLTQFSTRTHLIRAALEAVCFQTKEIVDAMVADCGYKLEKLQVDGGMSTNNLLMQIQSDILGIPVVRPIMHETTALGAAIAAGAAEGVNVWNLNSTAKANATCDFFMPSIIEQGWKEYSSHYKSFDERERRYSRWKEAVKRSMHWEQTDDETTKLNLGPRYLQLSSLPGGIFLVSSFGALVLAQFFSRKTVC